MKILLLNQCFWPDVVATAQQLTDLAAGLSERGHEVTVVASDRGYDDQTRRFPRRERWRGTSIFRIRSLATGKGTRLMRALNFGSFMIACGWRLMLLPRQDVVVALTSPPLISWLAAMFTRLKGGKLVSWVMDLNPDEAIAAGWLKQNSIGEKLLSARLRKSLRSSARIVALDRFVKDRIVAKGITENKIEVIPPWSHDDAVRFDAPGRESFRRNNDLTGKFVVMYAGNHSPCHPLDTLLQAARELKTKSDIVFCFVGGGSEKKKVEEFALKNELKNVRSFRYFPMEDLSAVLSAADLHVVVMGDRFVGIIHPSKIYNILTIGSPFIYIGPEESHVTDIAAGPATANTSLLAQHHEAGRVVAFIDASAKNGLSRLQTSSHQFSKEVLLPRLMNLLEATSSAAAPCSSQVTAGNMQSA